MHDHMNVKSRY